MSMPKLIDLKDGSFASRKFLLTLVCILLLSGVSLSGVLFPAIVAILPTFVGGLLGIVSLYFTGNIMNKFVVGNNIAKIGTTSEDTTPDDPDAKED